MRGGPPLLASRQLVLHAQPTFRWPMRLQEHGAAAGGVATCVGLGGPGIPTFHTAVHPGPAQYARGMTASAASKPASAPWTAALELVPGPFPDGRLEVYPVSPRVNDARNERLELTEPLDALLLRGLLFGFAPSVTSDAVERVPTGRRADSL